MIVGNLLVLLVLEFCLVCDLSPEKNSLSTSIKFLSLRDYILRYLSQYSL